MARLLIVALALGVAVAAPPARAQTLDHASSEALAAALRMLTDPGARGAAIGANPSAGAADKQIHGSPALTQQLYELAGQIFEDLARGSGGDVTKMTESLQRAQSDPAGFAAKLSPRTLDRVRELSTKISDQRR